MIPVGAVSVPPEQTLVTLDTNVQLTCQLTETVLLAVTNLHECGHPIQREECRKEQLKAIQPQRYGRLREGLLNPDTVAAEAGDARR